MSRQRFITNICALLILSLLTLPGLTTATPTDTLDAETVDRKATAMFDSIMSPYCPGVTLSSCASSKATDLRNQIREWVQTGLDESAIQSRLIESYGATILGVPQGETAGKIGWLVPILATISGLVITTLALRYLVKKQQPRTQHSSADSVTDAVLERAVEKELAKRREIRNAKGN